jgi:hypothetical protein
MDWEAEIASSRVPQEPDVHFADYCDICEKHISWIDKAWITSTTTFCAECAEGAGFQADEPLHRRPSRTQKVGN